MNQYNGKELAEKALKMANGRNVLHSLSGSRSFAETILSAHRTLQQLVIGTLFRLLYALALERTNTAYGVDDRNRASYEALATFKKLVDDGDLNIYFPYI